MKDMLYLNFLKNETSDTLEALSYISKSKCYNVYRNKNCNGFLIWDVYFDNTSWKTDYHIATRHINVNSLDRLLTMKSERMTVIDYDESKDTNGTFKITLHNTDTKTIDLIFDKKYKVLHISTDTYSELRVHDISLEDSDLEEEYYLDKDLFFIRNLRENSETVYIDNKEIKYEFKDNDLTISKYLLLHRPFRVTNYTDSIQYVIEYDEYGLVKSMRNISEPNKELCTYKVSDIGVSNIKQRVSIHPNLYNNFNIANSFVGNSYESLLVHDGSSYSYRVENDYE